MKKLLIFYLTSNDRHFVFERLLKELESIENKKLIEILIVNSNKDNSFYEYHLGKSQIFYKTTYVECPQSNYLPKVRYAIEYAKKHEYKYIMKLDNDVIIPAYTIDYLVSNLSILEEESAVTISPTISTGIPSVEYFIDDFFDDEEARKIRGEFNKCVFNVQHGIMDYTPLNINTINNESNWDYKKYFDYLNFYVDNLPDMGGGRTINNYCKFYKGIHPVRHGFGNDIINEGIINKRNYFFNKKICFPMKADEKAYLCNMCFIIRTNIYDRIINEDSLIIDGCDEVPINRFTWDNNKRHVIIRGAFAIHITYNWRWFLNTEMGGSNISKPSKSLEDYELDFIKNLYKNEEATD